MKRSLLALLLLLPLAVGDETKPKKAPDFTLKNPDGKEITLSKVKADWVVLEWINHGCPYVKKHYKVNNMQSLQQKWTKKGVAWIAICSSAEGKQGFHTPEGWKQVIKDKKMAATEVLIDADGKVGHLYNAKRTPTFFILNKKREIVYWGGIDDAPRARTAEAIADATCHIDVVLTAVTAGKPAPYGFKPPYG